MNDIASVYKLSQEYEEFIRDVAGNLATKVRGTVAYNLSSPTLDPATGGVYYHIREHGGTLLRFLFNPLGRLHLVFHGHRCGKDIHYLAQTSEAETTMKEMENKKKKYDITTFLRD